MAQPDWSALFCILASSLGYALFWKSIESSKRRFLWALLWFGAIQIIHLGWLFSDRYVGAYILIFLIVASLYLGIQFGFITLAIGDFQKLSISRILAVSGLLTLFEWSRLFVLSGFSWNPLGLSLSGTLYSMQFASFLGVFGLSFWVMLTNLLALRSLVSFSFKPIGIWVVFFALPYIFGFFQVSFHGNEMKKGKEELKTLLVQTSLYPEQKISIDGSIPLAPARQWQHILTLLYPYKDKPIDLIVLSEAVVPYGTDNPIYHLETVKTLFSSFFGRCDFLPSHHGEKVGNGYWAQCLSNLFQADVVIGLEDEEIEPLSLNEKAYNAAFLFRPFSGEKNRYEKRVLIPSEYSPFEWCRPILSKYGIEDFFCHGKEAKVFEGKRTKLSMSICYEETFGHLIRENRKKGANLLINLTNDVWYPDSRLPMVHFMHGRLRAVESGVPVLRSCNTGVTCGLDALGRVLGKLDYEKASQKSPAGALYLSIPIYDFFTFYALFGDAPIVLISLFFIAVLAVKKTKELSMNDLYFYLLRKNK